MIPVIVGCLLGAVVLAYTFAPYMAARAQARPMTHREREQLSWGGLAVALALFLLAVLTIGARP